MQAIALLHFVLRWLMVVIGAGLWIWLTALLLALSGWVLWTAQHVVARVLRAIGSSGRGSREPVADTQHSPAPMPSRLQMTRRR